MEKSSAIWLCIICLVAGVAGDHFLGDYFKSSPAPPPNVTTVQKHPQAADALEPLSLDDAFASPDGDTYIMGKDHSLWVVRQDEAMRVRTVSKFQNGTTSPTTQSATDFMMKTAIARQIRLAKEDVESSIEDNAQSSSSDGSNDANDNGMDEGPDDD